MKIQTIAILLLGLLGFQLAAAEGRWPDRDVIMPTVEMNNVPLRDFIGGLARQAGFNYVLDPAVVGSFAGPGGQFAREPIVTARWTNVTGRHVLDEVLASNKLTIVTNPVTTVARITLASQRVKPVAASELGTDTNAPLPMVRMVELPLREAIETVARRAGIKSDFDPAADPLLGSIVNIRWENLTPKQALVALLDNYGLAMNPKPGTDRVVIGLKPKEAP